MERHIDIAVRGFMLSSEKLNEEARPFYANQKDHHPPYHSRILVFDTETTVDEYQNFLFGQAWLVVNEKNNKVEHAVNAPTTHIQRYFIVADDFDAVYHGKNSVEDAKRIMQTYVNEHANEYQPCSLSIDPKPQYLWPRSIFVREVLLPEITLNKTTLVGFNLPFDLSRIAVGCSVTADKTSFRFSLLEDTKSGSYPGIVIKPLDSKKAFISLDLPYNVISDYKEEHHRGSFLDLRTAIFALTNKAANLKHATTVLYPVSHPKAMEDDAEHGTITNSYLNYNTRDLQATWELYCQVNEDYRCRHETLAVQAKMEIERLYSPASIGKAYFKAMGIRPFMEKNPEFPKDVLGYVMSSFYAGRSEVHIRNHPIQTFHVDVHSMYPSVFVLTKLWQYVIAESISTVNLEDPKVTKTQEHAKLLQAITGMGKMNLPVPTEKTNNLARLEEEINSLPQFPDETEAMRVWMEAITLESLLQPETWQHLVGIVKVRPNHDLLPVRAKYGQSWNIGWNYLTSEVPLWYTIADVLAAKILTGKLPEIEQVIRFYPGGPQADLKSLDMSGLGIHGQGVLGRFAPAKEDFFKTVIEARTRVKKERDQHAKGSATYQQLDGQQEGLKILANATSYGINVELNREESEEPTTFDVFSVESSQATLEAFEKPGPFFNPIVATTITGTAHLMLAIIQKLTEQFGGDYALMDTDSSFIVDQADIGKPLREQHGNPRSIGQKVMDGLRSLYPYDDNPERALLEMEKDSEIHDPLYIYAVSAKRYATFVLDSTSGQPAIVEAKTHGLAYARPKNLPDGETWEMGIWRHLISHAMGQKFQDNLPPWLNNVVTMSIGVTTPYLYQQIHRFRQGNRYAASIKPWNFFTLAIGIGDMLSADRQAIRGWQDYFWKEYQASQQDSLFTRVKEVTGGKMILNNPHDLAGEFAEIPRQFLRKHGIPIDEVADVLGMELRDLLSALQSYQSKTKQKQDFLLDAERQAGMSLPKLSASTINRYYCQTYHVIAEGTCRNKSLCDHASSCLANRLVKPISLDGGQTWQEMTTRENVYLDTENYEVVEYGEIPTEAIGHKRFSTKTYAAILSTHDKHPERKYDGLNGEACTASTQGRLQPTHVMTNKIVVIGKETGDMLEVTTKTNMLADLPDAEREQTLMIVPSKSTTSEESKNVAKDLRSSEGDTTIQGFSREYWETLRAKLRTAIQHPTPKQKARGMKEVSLRQLAKALEINAASLSKFLTGKTTLHPDHRVKVETWVQAHGGLGVDGYKTTLKDFGPNVASMTEQPGNVFTAQGKVGRLWLADAKTAFPEAFFTLYDVEYVRMNEALERWLDDKSVETLPDRITSVIEALESGIRVWSDGEWSCIPYADIEKVYLRMGGNGKYQRKSRVLVTKDGLHFEFVKKENLVFETYGFVPTWKQCIEALCWHHSVKRAEDIPSVVKAPYKFIGKELPIYALVKGISRKGLAARLGLKEAELLEEGELGQDRYLPQDLLLLLANLKDRSSSLDFAKGRS